MDTIWERGASGDLTDLPRDEVLGEGHLGRGQIVGALSFRWLCVLHLGHASAYAKLGND